MSMASFADRLGEAPGQYVEMAATVHSSFQRFWREARGYCFDVIDGPDGDDARLRPNRIMAASLFYSPLSTAQQRAVVDVCAHRLLTPYGLRSLADDDPDYVGKYGGSPHQRDAAYHQGTVWAWLIGPFVEAHLHVYADTETARTFLDPLFLHLHEHGVGSISEIFEGDPPFLPRGAVAQAWSVAEILRAWQILNSQLHST
jgi:glycogen debranching enzyme